MAEHQPAVDNSASSSHLDNAVAERNDLESLGAWSMDQNDLELDVAKKVSNRNLYIPENTVGKLT